MGRHTIQRGFNKPIRRALSTLFSLVTVLLAGEGSNLQHPAPKAGVLPIELPAKERQFVAARTSLALGACLPLSCRTTRGRAERGSDSADRALPDCTENVTGATA